jgi:hypothetical protein
LYFGKTEKPVFKKTPVFSGIPKNRLSLINILHQVSIIIMWATLSKYGWLYIHEHISKVHLSKIHLVILGEYSRCIWTEVISGGGEEQTGEGRKESEERRRKER